MSLEMKSVSLFSDPSTHHFVKRLLFYFKPKDLIYSISLSPPIIISCCPSYLNDLVRIHWWGLWLQSYHDHDILWETGLLLFLFLLEVTWQFVHIWNWSVSRFIHCRTVENTNKKRNKMNLLFDYDHAYLWRRAGTKCRVTVAVFLYVFF